MQTQTKLIFLDIDGVLNCGSTHNPRNFPYVVEASLLKKLMATIDATGAQVVLSSTWRYDPVGLLAARHHGVPFIDVLPDLENHSRKNEIMAWLASHQTVTRYAVIDDEDDDLDDLPLFQPSAKMGLTDEVAQAVTRYLNGETNRVVRGNVIKRNLQNIMNAIGGHKG